MRVSAFSTRKQSRRPELGRARMLTWLLLGLLVFCVYSIPALAADPADSGRPQLTAINVSGDVVKLNASGAMKHSIVASADPFKLIVELESVSAGQFSAPIRPQSSVVSEIVVSQTQAPRSSTLITMALSAPAQAQIAEKVNSLEIAFAETAQASQKSVEPATAPASKSADKLTGQSMSAAAKEITDVLLEKTEHGAELIFKTDGRVKDPAVYDVDGKLIIDIPVSSMKASLPVKMVAPVRDIKYRIERDRVRFIIEPTFVVDTQVTVLDDELVVDFKSNQGLTKPDAAKKMAEEQVSPTLKKKTISLDFQDADIVPILRLLGDVSGYNMVIHPDVKGRITMKLKNSPWDQALDIILKTFALEKAIDGNVIRIMTAKAYQEEKKAVADAREAVGRAENISSKIYIINNANTEKMRESIDKSKVLSPRGSISVDARTRSLIVKDVPSVHFEVKQLIEQLDKPTPQVFIDARLVEATSNFARELGIEWSGALISSERRAYAKGSQSASGILGGLTNAAGDVVFKTVSLPTATTPAGAMSFGYMNKQETLALEARISAYEATGKARTVSNPKVLTVDNEQAVIKHGAQIPVTTRNADGTFSTVYKDANLKLTVTPQISPDGTVFMKVEVTKDEPDFTRTDLLGNPTINSRQASTQLYVKDGETVVIGGILKTKDSDGEQAVPGLSKIPLLGLLFKNSTVSTESEELLLFITPRIVKR